MRLSQYPPLICTSLLLVWTLYPILQFAASRWSSGINNESTPGAVLGIRQTDERRLELTFSLDEDLALFKVVVVESGPLRDDHAVSKDKTSEKKRGLGLVTPEEVEQDSHRVEQRIDSRHFDERDIRSAAMARKARTCSKGGSHGVDDADCEEWDYFPAVIMVLVTLGFCFSLLVLMH